MIPQTVAHHQAPPSIEFPRQEYWSGLPLPSSGGLPDPGMEPWSPALQADSLPSEPEKLLFSLCCLCSVAQSCLTLCNSVDSNPPGSSVHGDSPGKTTGVGCHAFLQGIFATQGSNPGLPHCRQILPSEPLGKPKPGTFNH